MGIFYILNYVDCLVFVVIKVYGIMDDFGMIEV